MYEVTSVTKLLFLLCNNEFYKCTFTNKINKKNWTVVFLKFFQFGYNLQNSIQITKTSPIYHVFSLVNRMIDLNHFCAITIKQIIRGLLFDFSIIIKSNLC